MDTNLSHSVHDETITAVEVASQQNGVVSDRRPEAMGRDVQELPSGYFYSAHFIGSYCVSDTSVGLSSAEHKLRLILLHRPSDLRSPVELVALLWSRRY